MSDYFNKYKKYKFKYLNLLKQKGGAQVIDISINLEPYKELFRRFVFELNHEVAFSIDTDLESNKIISEFIKGHSYYSEEDDSKPLFDKKIYFTHLNCHTHDKYGCDIQHTTKYSPPSAKDYLLFINNYCKYYTNTNLIFAPEGIYEVSIGDKLISILNEEPLKQMLKIYAPMARRYTSTMGFKEWYDFEEEIHNRTNIANILLSKPKFYDKHKEEFEKIKNIHLLEFEKPMIETLEDYFDVIRHLGFNIRLHEWDEPLEIIIKMKKNTHEFLDSAVLSRKNGNLFYLLLTDPDDIREDKENEEDLNNDLLMPYYVNLEDYTIDELFNKVIAQNA
jgi:hypothetical protein